MCYFITIHEAETEAEIAATCEFEFAGAIPVEVLDPQIQRQVAQFARSTFPDDIDGDYFHIGGTYDVS